MMGMQLVTIKILQTFLFFSLSPSFLKFIFIKDIDLPVITSTYRETSHMHLNRQESLFLHVKSSFLLLLTVIAELRFSVLHQHSFIFLVFSHTHFLLYMMGP